jgi:hypothetical protein
MKTAEPDTNLQFDEVILRCRTLFEKKQKDYGTPWRILRMTSLTDQLFIKAQRIRSIEEKGIQMISDDITSELIGLINYSIISLIQLELKPAMVANMPSDEVMVKYDHFAASSKKLMEKKNHDYGEAWREMRVSSLTDLILSKIMRIKQIEDNNGTVIVSEGVDANYYDILNYSVFALIRMDETK